VAVVDLLVEFGDEIGVSLGYHTTLFVWSFWECFTTMFLGRGVRSVVRIGIQLIDFVSRSKQVLLSVAFLL
jgi:hypothetical protein